MNLAPLTQDNSVIEEHFDSNYLSRCQIATPDLLVKWVWQKISRSKPFPSVLDLGCGDLRFSNHGEFRSYLGVDIDNAKLTPIMPNVEVLHGCALTNDFKDYDLCIGNPPYVRHHDMDSNWRDNIAHSLTEASGIKIDKRANAYLYFILKALLSTHEEGITALVVPFEWISRPSSRWLRDFIQENGWHVSVYRLPENTFPRVLTTSSLAIIDKSKSSVWKYYSVNDKYKTTRTLSPSGTKKKVLAYTERVDQLFAQRGLSPGTQKVFCLNEEERLHSQLRVGKDVTPCVTSLRVIPKSVKVLTRKVFDEYYVDTGQRCWLVRSDRKCSRYLQRYLDSVNDTLRDTSTCNNRSVWYKYNTAPVPKLLYSVGFVKRSPLVIENQIGAIAVGAVGNILGARNIPMRRVAHKIRGYDFESSLVSHSGALVKVEVNQMNSVLQQILRELGF